MTQSQSAPSKHAAKPKDSSEAKGEYFERVRSLVEHEDELVNDRLTWLLTIEGFLIGGFIVAQTTFLSSEPATSVVAWTEILFAFVFVAAIWICYITGVNIAAAYEQVAAVSRAWEKRYPAEIIPVPDYPQWITEPVLPGDHKPNGPNLPKEKAIADAEKGIKAEYPPIFGSYRHEKHPRIKRWFTSAKRIPFILMLINLLAAVVSLAMIVVFIGHDVNKASADISFGRGGAHLTVKFEGDGSKERLASYLESVARSLETRPTTQP